MIPEDPKGYTITYSTTGTLVVTRAADEEVIADDCATREDAVAVALADSSR
jgi:hypothetical protein